MGIVDIDPATVPAIKTCISVGSLFESLFKIFNVIPYIPNKRELSGPYEMNGNVKPLKKLFPFLK